jgi:hypothetical protein
MSLCKTRFPGNPASKVQIMSEVSEFRLNIMRAYYLLLVVGIGIVFWPDLLTHNAELGRRVGAPYSMLATASILAVFGLRYPLQMVPVMLFEGIWKTLWIAAIFLPLWFAGEANARDWEDFFACALGPLLTPLFLPWGYVVRHYFLKPGEHGRGQPRERSLA